jgi:hypothetical protein
MEGSEGPIPYAYIHSFIHGDITIKCGLQPNNLIQSINLARPSSGTSFFVVSVAIDGF